MIPRFSGAPVGIRTLDLLIRSQTLYPAELRAHVVSRLHYDTSEIFKSQPRETILIEGCVLSGSRNVAGLFHLEVVYFDDNGKTKDRLREPVFFEVDCES